MDDVELHEPTMLENKTNQWLGVTVRSQGPGGKVMVRFAHIRMSFHLEQNFKSCNMYLCSLLFCWYASSSLVDHGDGFI